MKSLSSNKGFTVIEVLIATTILTFVVGVMTLSLLQQQRQFNITREATDLEQSSRIALDLIATEIRNAAARQGKFYSIDFTNVIFSGHIYICAAVLTSFDTTTISGPNCLILSTIISIYSSS